MNNKNRQERKHNYRGYCNKRQRCDLTSKTCFSKQGSTEKGFIGDSKRVRETGSGLYILGVDENVMMIHVSREIGRIFAHIEQG